jgi:flagellin
MSMVINTNTASMIAQAAQATTQREMETAMERLSTGKRINSAADDAAGMAMSSRMESQIKGLTMAIRNSGDAQSLIDATEGAHDEITNILHRMRELSVQAANSTNVSSDVANLQSEMDQLLAEINRIAGQTSWNGMNLMDGSFSSKSFQIGPDAGQKVSVSVADSSSTALGSYNFEAEGNVYVDAADVTTGAFTADTYTFSGVKGNANVTTLANDTAKEFAAAINAKTHLTGVSASAVTNVLISAGGVTGTNATEAVSGTVAVDMNINDVAIATAAITSSDMRGLRDAINAIAAQTGVTAKMGSSNADIILTDIDGDDIIIDNFDTDDNGTILGVAALKADQSTYAVGAGSATDPSEAVSTDKYGSVTVLTDANTAGFQYVAIGGSTTLTSTGDFTVTGGAALTGNDAAAAGHIKSTSASGTFSAISASNITTLSGAETAIKAIDGAIDMITARRANLGAISNRLDYTMNNLTDSRVNMEASQSRIEDADFAIETSNLTKAQILSQAATAMLAQANASKQSVLSLLQG